MLNTIWDGIKWAIGWPPPQKKPSESPLIKLGKEIQEQAKASGTPVQTQILPANSPLLSSNVLANLLNQSEFTWKTTTTTTHPYEAPPTTTRLAEKNVAKPMEEIVNEALKQKISERQRQELVKVFQRAIQSVKEKQVDTTEPATEDKEENNNDGFKFIKLDD